MKDFLRGMGSVINLFPVDRNVMISPQHSDAEAIRSDWEKVGKDMQVGSEKSNLQEIEQKSHG